MRQGIVKKFLRSHFDKEGGIKDNGFRVQGSGFRVQGSGFRVQGSGFRVQGSGFRGPWDVPFFDCV